ncbi:MAG: hypothetical protein K5900_00805 [Butyrivibrio sp.]|nr:hypothetical protein [Butyrivibrio sp.]
MASKVKWTSDINDLKDIMPQGSDRIPKILHYCWFGGNPIPEDLQKCLDSWEKLAGFTIMRWDETNCTFDECVFVQKAYSDKKWCFVGDYYRLKYLCEYGGIYLDTDVFVNKSFDKLLANRAFLNFIFDSAVGTAVMGCEKNNPLFVALLDMYNNTVFDTVAEEKQVDKRLYYKDGKYHIKGYITNNYYFTYYILKNYPKFKLGNIYQELGDFTIYPKEFFEIGRLSLDHYAIHLCAGEWRSKENATNMKARIKNLLMSCPFLFDYIRIIVRKKRYKNLNKSNPFYKCYLAQKSGQPMPEL